MKRFLVPLSIAGCCGAVYAKALHTDPATLHRQYIQSLFSDGTEELSEGTRKELSPYLQPLTRQVAEAISNGTAPNTVALLGPTGSGKTAMLWRLKQVYPREMSLWHVDVTSKTSMLEVLVRLVPPSHWFHFVAWVHGYRIGDESCIESLSSAIQQAQEEGRDVVVALDAKGKSPLTPSSHVGAFSVMDALKPTGAKFLLSSRPALQMATDSEFLQTAVAGPQAPRRSSEADAEGATTPGTAPSGNVSVVTMTGLDEAALLNLWKDQTKGRPALVQEFLNKVKKEGSEANAISSATATDEEDQSQWESGDGEEEIHEGIETADDEATTPGSEPMPSSEGTVREATPAPGPSTLTSTTVEALFQEWKQARITTAATLLCSVFGAEDTAWKGSRVMAPLGEYTWSETNRGQGVTPTATAEKAEGKDIGEESPRSNPKRLANEEEISVYEKLILWSYLRYHCQLGREYEVMMKLKGTQHPKSATAVLNALCQMPVFYGKEVHLTVAMMNLLEKQWVELVPRHGDPAPEPQQETKAEGGNPSNEVDTELFTWDLEPAPFVSEAFRTVYEANSHAVIGMDKLEYYFQTLTDLALCDQEIEDRAVQGEVLTQAWNKLQDMKGTLSDNDFTRARVEENNDLKSKAAGQQKEQLLQELWDTAEFLQGSGLKLSNDDRYSHVE